MTRIPPIQPIMPPRDRKRPEKKETVKCSGSKHFFLAPYTQCVCGRIKAEQENNGKPISPTHEG